MAFSIHVNDIASLPQRASGSILSGDHISVFLPILSLHEQLLLRASCPDLRSAVTSVPCFWDEVLHSRAHRCMQKDAFVNWQRYKDWIREALKRSRLRQLQHIFLALRRSRPMAWTRYARSTFRALVERTNQSKLLRLCLRRLHKHLVQRRLMVQRMIGCYSAARECLDAMATTPIMRHCFEQIKAVTKRQGKELCEEESVGIEQSIKNS